MQRRPGLGVYLITDRNQLPTGASLIDRVEAGLLGGIRAVQLREKDLPAADLYEMALVLRPLTRKHGAALLINDRVDVALAAKADGVHLGRRSLPVPAVRRLAGPKFLIGVSTHTPAEAEQAEREGADFLTYGPVYPTPSKMRYGPPRGVEELAAVCAAATIPVYGLGGVTAQRKAEVLAAGASGVAVISAILAANDPRRAAVALVAEG